MRLGRGFGDGLFSWINAVFLCFIRGRSNSEGDCEYLALLEKKK